MSGDEKVEGPDRLTPPLQYCSDPPVDLCRRSVIGSDLEWGEEPGERASALDGSGALLRAILELARRDRVTATRLLIPVQLR